MIRALETPRLFLKPLELADAPQIQTLFPQWEIVKFLNNKVPWPYPPDGALQYCRDMAFPAMERGEAWHWTIRPKTAPETMIGFISLIKSVEENRGFWLDPKWQGRGLMSEACDAVTDYWFNELGFTVLHAPKAIANEASRRISLKQGMRVIAKNERDYVSGRLPSETWEITAEEWRSRKRAK
ncbi:MAG TPA: GNAT family N-acetyltransferase [Candidatus Dormibacteraeota bacterium]|jgi:ribosomal-protein-alanine N-acetyltransferase|nr:GNAT family N-acetyltransferase [Candidatus Dormibacteraeota bacterium]